MDRPDRPARPAPTLALALGLALTLLAPADPARAGIETFPGATCTSPASCALEIAPGLRIEGPSSAFWVHEDGRGFDFLHDDQYLVARLCADSAPGGPPCLETFRGTQRAQAPSFGILDALVTQQAPMSTVGLDTGANLEADVPELAGLLAPDGRYLVYHTRETAFEASIPGLDLPGLSSGGDTTTLVVSQTTRLEEAFFYFEGELPGFPFGGKKKKGQDEGEGQSGDGSQSGSGDGSDPNSQGDGDGSHQSGDPDDPNAQNDEPATNPDEGEAEEADAEQESGGDRVRIGFSYEPRLRFVPIMTENVEDVLVPFQGNMLVAGPIPVAKLIALEGEAVLDLDPDRDGDHPFTEAFYSSVDLQIGGNGTLVVDVPFLEWLGVDMHLGSASVLARIADLSDRAAFSGEADDSRFLGSLPVPITPFGNRRLAVSGAIDSEDLLSSFIHGEGWMGLDMHPLGQALGLSLPTLEAEGSLDINVAGLAVTARTRTALRADLSYGEIGLAMHVPPSLGHTEVTLFGDMAVGGLEMASGRVTVTPDGATITGVYQKGDTVFQMSGELLAVGHVLSGSATLANPIVVEPAELAAAADALLADEARRDALEAVAAAAQADAAAARAAFQSAADDVAAARAEVSRLSALVDSYTSSRDYAYSRYRSWVNKSCKWYDAKCQATRSANITYWYGRYTYYAGLRASTVAARTAAMTVLAGLEVALRSAELAAAGAENAAAVAASQLDEAAAALLASRERYEALQGLAVGVTPAVWITLENGQVTSGTSATFQGVTITGRSDLDAGLACLTIPPLGEHCSPM